MWKLELNSDHPGLTDFSGRVCGHHCQTVLNWLAVIYSVFIVSWMVLSLLSTYHHLSTSFYSRFSKMLFGAVYPLLLSPFCVPPHHHSLRTCTSSTGGSAIKQREQAEMQATAVAQLLMILQNWSSHLWILLNTEHLTSYLFLVTGFLCHHFLLSHTQ